MEEFDPILKKLENKLRQFLQSGEVMKLMDQLGRQGVWADLTVKPGGPGVLTGDHDITIPGPMKDEVLCRLYRWIRDYDQSFLKANRIKS